MQASHYTAAVLNGLPVPRGQPAMVTISQARRAEGRRLNRPGLRLRTAQVDSRDVGSEWGMAVLTELEQLSMWPACTASRQAWSWRIRRWRAAWRPQPTSIELRRQWPGRRNVHSSRRRPGSSDWKKRVVVVRRSRTQIQRNPARVIDRIVRQSRIAGELYGAPLHRPDGMAWH